MVNWRTDIPNKPIVLIMPNGEKRKFIVNEAGQAREELSDEDVNKDNT